MDSPNEISDMQHYSLRWNNHGSNLLLVFEQLFRMERFADVTIDCQGESVKCHKMVLAACSSYFNYLFTSDEYSHAIVVLSDIRFPVIKAILEYMYKGEVNIAQNQMADFLKAAEKLEVKGLVEIEDTQSGSKISAPPVRYPNSAKEAIPDFQGNINQTPPMKNQNHSTFDSRSSSSSYYSPETEIVQSMQRPLLFPFAGDRIDPFSSYILPSILSNLQNKSIFENNQLDNYQFLRSPDCTSFPTNLKHKTKPVTLDNGTTHQHQPSNEINDTDSSSSSDFNNETYSNSTYDLGDFLSDCKKRSLMQQILEDNDSMMPASPKGKNAKSTGSPCKSAKNVLSPGKQPVWKRYKQYKNSDVMNALEDVKAGMSALGAARKHGIPSRTLYEKAKRLGITTAGRHPSSVYQRLPANKDSGYDFNYRQLEDLQDKKGNEVEGSSERDNSLYEQKRKNPNHRLIGLIFDEEKINTAIDNIVDTTSGTTSSDD